MRGGCCKHAPMKISAFMFDVSRSGAGLVDGKLADGRAYMPETVSAGPTSRWRACLPISQARELLHHGMKDPDACCRRQPLERTACDALGHRCIALIETQRVI